MRLLASLAVAVTVTGGVAAADGGFTETRIPHRDGSGRATVVEMDPTVPGAHEFVEADDHPPPRRGELSVPSPTPGAAPSPAGHGRSGR